MIDRARTTLRATSERGQTMAEYAIVTSVISVGVVGALTTLSGPIGSGIQRVADIVLGVG